MSGTLQACEQCKAIGDGQFTFITTSPEMMAAHQALAHAPRRRGHYPVSIYTPPPDGPTTLVCTLCERQGDAYGSIDPKAMVDHQRSVHGRANP